MDRQTEELAESTPASIVKIATTGDIVLVVGSQKRKLLVDSGVLKNASKVFSAMFGPYFSEGQDLAANTPKEVPMPDDNPEALTIMCRILHLCNDLIPDSLTPVEVLEIAIAADKFDCVLRLKVHTAQWLILGDTQDILDLGRLMAASYLLDNPSAFRKFTLTIIFCSKETYIPLDAELGDHVPPNTFWLLEERRSVLRTKLERLILQGTSYPTCSRSWCDFPSRYAYGYIQLLQSAKLWPIATANMSISDAIDALERMGNPNVSLVGIGPCKNIHSIPDCKESRAEALNELKNSVGLCLDCMLLEDNLTSQNCRIKH